MALAIFSVYFAIAQRLTSSPYSNNTVSFLQYATQLRVKALSGLGAVAGGPSCACESLA